MGIFISQFAGVSLKNLDVNIFNKKLSTCVDTLSLRSTNDEPFCAFLRLVESRHDILPQHEMMNLIFTLPATNQHHEMRSR
jgi:hypothetical protein